MKNTMRTISRNSLLKTLCTSTPRRVRTTTPRPYRRSSSPTPTPTGPRDASARADLVKVPSRGESGTSDPSDLHRAAKADTRSPFERHRFQGTLSVSDLVGPAWCEVQFDYGLRQGRSLALAFRPDSFVSAEGKVITVAKKAAAVNERVLGHGRSVHKELEREIPREEVIVSINSQEEYWAARLVNMLASLDILMQPAFGFCCREMPVFGIVQDQPIVGMIDEVLLKSIPTSVSGTPKRAEKRRRDPSPSQSHLTDFFASPSQAEARESASPPRPMVHELSLIDTKTRRSASLPSDDDAFPSRMQLMLYRHLLSALLSPRSRSTRSGKRFTSTFLLQSGLARELDGKIVLGYPACLDDLEGLWRSKVHSLHIQGVSPTLEIVYRTQPKRSLVPNTSRSDILDDFGAAQREALDIARAIAASLDVHEHDSDLERAIAESLRDMPSSDDSGSARANGRNAAGNVQFPSPRSAEQLSDKPRIPWYARKFETARPMEGWSTAELGPPGLLTPLPRPETSRIIGRKVFAFDETAMHAYVQDVLQWWRGERPPRGVDVEHCNRCLSCEYREDCEWREMKAKEAQEKYIKHKPRQREGAGRFGFDTT
ncbi:exonuclease V [Russula brevipes]|nr:exonuclease V [Russula brevipes]